MPPKISTNFWKYVDIAGPGECWDWLAGQHDAGYGRFRLDDKTIFAHRHAYTLIKGPIPEGMQVCHTCDRPECCNPDHLFLGTTADNMRDACKKGRKAIKLTEEAVRDIRASERSGTPRQVIAKKYGVTVGLICRIVNGQRWQHVDEDQAAVARERLHTWRQTRPKTRREGA